MGKVPQLRYLKGPAPLSLSGRKGGETADEGMEPEGELREVSVTETITPEAPKTEMEAVFELGATQSETQQLRREVQACLSENAQLRALVADLEQTVSQTRTELSQEIAESRHAEQQITEHHHAKWWERLMAGTG